jgi:hypothetical protein
MPGMQKQIAALGGFACDGHFSRGEEACGLARRVASSYEQSVTPDEYLDQFIDA